MIRILDWYIARTLLGTVTVTLSVLIGLSALIKFVEQLRKVGEGNYDMLAALVYVLLSLPRDLEQFFPMAVLLGGLIGMGVLASNSELTIMRAAGVSIGRIVWAVMKPMLALMLVGILIGEYVAPLTENQAHAIAHLLIGGIQFRLFRGFGGCGTAGHEAGHCQCKERFLHCIIL